MDPRPGHDRRTFTSTTVTTKTVPTETVTFTAPSTRNKNRLGLFRSGANFQCHWREKNLPSPRGLGHFLFNQHLLDADLACPEASQITATRNCGHQDFKCQAHDVT
ncbi:unnamed protein product [Durusdinium trenchii]|uniref:Uncharacterized protein n=1 Tax=Durusdinium trenchii TaxID=1381693 RepID=A0ABP0JJ09_9DINO